MRFLFATFILILFLIPTENLAQENPDTIGTDPIITTQFLDNLDSLANLYYIRQALKLQSKTNGAKKSDQIPVEPDEVIEKRLNDISSVIPLQYNKIVRAYIDVYTLKKRNFVEAMLGLTDYYFPMFEEVLSLYGLPLELKYLSIVESALNPNAVSRAGATGIWQFMYTTAKIYNLEINSFVDERRDPLKSTYAAAEYLSELYSLYGEWSLAIAAYNCGPGNVNKAIRRANGKNTFWEIYKYLPMETRGYVPSFIAALYLMNYYEEHNLQKKPIDIPLITDTVMVRNEASISRIADLLNLPVDQLRYLNPQYKTDIIPAKTKQYPFRLPVNFGPLFIDLEDSIYNIQQPAADTTADTIIVPEPQKPVVKTYTPREPEKPSNTVAVYYTVKTGDNLGYIATWFDVSISSIRQWNNLSRNLIRPGQKLVIYVPKSKTSYYKNINTMSFDEKQNLKSPSANTQKPAYTGQYFYHTVKSGETIWSISKLYPNVTEQEIMRLNGITNSRSLKPGQKLKIPKK